MNMQRHRSHLGQSPVLAVIIAAAFLTITACEGGGGERLLRSDLVSCAEVAQPFPGNPYQWPSSQPVPERCQTARPRRCEVQAGNHVTRYRCTPR